MFQKHYLSYVNPYRMKNYVSGAGGEGDRARSGRVASLIYHFLCGKILNNPFNKAENLSKLLRMAVTSLEESILL